MENQHRKIKGYRELSQEEIDLMNEIKEVGVALELLSTKLQLIEDKGGEPASWVKEGRMSLKKGLMAWTRSVAQPGFF